MILDELSPEILDIIIGHLKYAPDPDSALLPTQSNLLNARLVCRKWHKFATAHAFYTLTLLPTKTGFEKWKHIIGNDAFRSAARRVVIYSAPPGLMEGRDYRVWGPWEREGIYPEFTDAIDQIAILPHLRKVCLSFSEYCQGVENDLGFDDEVEVIPTRLNTLKAVFGAVQQRAKMNHPGTVSSLRVDNLQNIPTPEFTSSDLFKAVAKDLDELHLRVAHEYNEGGPDHDIYCVELTTFEPFMHQHWLSPLENQLTTLTLYFQDCWGVMPGTFDGHGLTFPRLQTLNLGNYTIAHHDQFDWVLAQTSLKSLRLDRCYIASHIRTEESSMHKWNTPTGDWERFPEYAFGFCRDEDEAVYHFPGTWKAIFDKVRTQLPDLTDFRFHFGRFAPASFFEPASMGAELSPLRYITFDIGLLPTRWIEADEHDGEMEFGNNDPSPFDIESDKNSYATEGTLNRSKETWDGDLEAFNALLDATYERRKCL